MKNQAGFTIISLIIAIASIVVIGGGSVAVYSVQKNHEAEKSSLRLELQLLQEQRTSPTQEPAEEVQSDPSPSPTPDPTPTAAPKPVVKAATTAAPSPSSEVPVPQLVVEEYKKALGRNPGLSDIDYWKAEYRKNGWTREQLRANILAEEKRGIERAAELKQQEEKTQEQTTQNLLLKDSQCKVVAQQWSDAYTATTAPYFRNNPGFVVAEAAKLYQLQYNECMASSN